jgi:hypothetical protein
VPDVTIKRLDEFEAIFGGGFKRVRAGLGVSSFGIAVLDFPANFIDYPSHNQTHDHQEEVYTVLEGRVTLHVGSDEDAVEYELEPGVWARVGPAETRKLITGDERARVVALGGIPGEVYNAPEFTDEGAPDPMKAKWAAHSH